MTVSGDSLALSTSHLAAGSARVEHAPSRESQVLARVLAAQAPDQQSVGEIVDTDGATLGSVGVQSEAQQLGDQLLGFGPLTCVLQDQDVTDVLVNADGAVWIDRGRGLVRAHDALSPGQVRPLAVRLAGMAGRRLDNGAPWVDGYLPGGIRLHAILAPIAADGAHLSLRIPRRAGWELTHLRHAGMIDDLLTQVLQKVIDSGSSFLISGGTGSGKTSLLGAMLGSIPHQERLVVVEDVREVQIRHPHAIFLQGRSPNVEGTGEVTQVTLVRQALRMRPDRLVVGEVRGAEVRELLAALNTGHRGGCGTVHANSAAHVIPRLLALGALAGMSTDAVLRQLSGAVDVVIHVNRHLGHRLVESVAAVRGEQIEPIVVGTWTDHGCSSQPGPGWDRWVDWVGWGSNNAPR